MKYWDRDRTGPLIGTTFWSSLEAPDHFYFILKVLLLFQQLKQPMTGIEGFKYIKPVTVKEV